VSAKQYADDPLESARRRVLILNVQPEVDHGRYPAKAVCGDSVAVQADLVADGHDQVAGAVRYRHQDEPSWHEIPMKPLGNDRWHAELPVMREGRWLFEVEAWIDTFGTWREDMRKRVSAGQDVSVDLLIGARLVEAAVERASGEDARRLDALARRMADTRLDQSGRVAAALDRTLAEVMARHPDRFSASIHAQREVVVDRERARFSAWYEMFPRSFGPPGEHGTFGDAEKHLHYIAALGFDVVYLPPIHPIGKNFRKGRNNTLQAEPEDPGSPWAIGASEGGHTAIHPELGTLDDFRHFCATAQKLGLEVALDVAFQTSPDHPWVKDHPEWFVQRPDGAIQYAENPPKKYQDIYPLHFGTADWRELWNALLGVFLHWMEQGVRIFRVDNPHTKSLRFWEWCIAELKKRDPGVILLSEAFTRPKLMYALAKLGFTQSYTYFTWRNTKHELMEYMNELISPQVASFFRPNFWPNTPDILPEHLQHGGRGAFMGRLVLAATLSSSYGIYGPAYELMEHVARPGSEEYMDNEKYELKSWNIDRQDSLCHFITRINQIRRQHPALHRNDSLRFHHTDNDWILCYSKRSPEPAGEIAGKDDSGGDRILVAIDLDWQSTQATGVRLDLDALGLDPDAPFEVHDLLTGSRYTWQGSRAYVELAPHIVPAHIFHVTQPMKGRADGSQGATPV
jgi:starch synthase (maltosyl-transferring)